MADSKANGLVKRVFSSLADLTGVRIWTQKEGEVDALGLEASELLHSDPVTDNSIDYKALTPKGFNDSAADVGVAGVVELSSDEAIQDKDEETVLMANDQEVMQEQWWKDWFIQSGNTPNKYASNYVTAAQQTALSFTVNIEKTLTENVPVTISPPLASGLLYKRVSIQYANEFRSSGGASHITLAYTGALVIVALSADVAIGLTANGQEIFVIGTLNGSLYLSATINAVLYNDQ